MICANTQPGNIRHPEWPLATESNVTQAVETRFKTMDLLAQRKYLTVVYHETYPGVGYIVQDGGAFDWVPLAT